MRWDLVLQSLLMLVISIRQSADHVSALRVSDFCIHARPFKWNGKTNLHGGHRGCPVSFPAAAPVSRGLRDGGKEKTFHTPKHSGTLNQTAWWTEDSQRRSRPRCHTDAQLRGGFPLASDRLSPPGNTHSECYKRLWRRRHLWNENTTNAVWSHADESSRDLILALERDADFWSQGGLLLKPVWRMMSLLHFTGHVTVTWVTERVQAERSEGQVIDLQEQGGSFLPFRCSMWPRGRC